MSSHTTNGSPRLFLRSAAGQEAGQKVLGWMGGWPPPGDIWVIREKLTSRLKVIEPDVQPEGWCEYFEKADGYEVFKFRLNQVFGGPFGEQKARQAEYVVTSGG